MRFVFVVNLCDDCGASLPDDAHGCLRFCKECAARRNRESAAKHPDPGYRREYRRVTELQRRGRIDRSTLNMWRERNHAGNWERFAS